MLRADSGKKNLCVAGYFHHVSFLSIPFSDHMCLCGQALASVWMPDMLLIVTSDYTHAGPSYRHPTASTAHDLLCAPLL